MFAQSTFIFSGFLRAMVNWKTWVPLSRLVYTSYLIHAVVISRFIYAQMSLVDMTQDNMVRLQEIQKKQRPSRLAIYAVRCVTIINYKLIHPLIVHHY